MKTLLLTFSLPILFLTLTASADTENSPLSFELELNQENYAWNDDLTAEVVLRNTTQYDVTLEFPNSCYFGVSVENSAGETVLEEDVLCAQVIAEIPVASGGIWTVSETLELDGMAGLPAGEYDLVIENNASVESDDGNNYSLATQYLSFELTRPLTIEYELDQSDYSGLEEINLSYTIENEGGEDYSFEIGGCNPYVSFYDAVTGDLALDEMDMNQGCTDDQGTAVVEPGETYTGTKTLTVKDLDLEAEVYTLGLSLLPSTHSFSFHILGDGFADITDHWAEEYIQELQLEGVVEGYSANWFKPDQAITRAEFLKILFEAMELDLTANLSGSSFEDVEEEDWAYLYTESAYEAGIVSGYEDQTFAPDQEITRAEATSMILASIGVDVDNLASRSNMFTDVSVEWQIRVIMEAYVRNIVSGYYNGDNQPNWTFGPNNSLTRAEACKLAVEARK